MVVKCYLSVTPSCHVASQRIQELLGALFKQKYVILNGEQDFEYIIRMRMG